ncbi:RNA polymerase sigma factor [Tenacibaculum sp. MEBiC06402]|uniref:RNA polymerase sigma factor n=1 Tax=unclassified Tenacibaculum TaxID=2635139 RepID=UPI003B9B775A
MKLEKLIKSCVKGDMNAQSIIYNRYKDSLFSLSLKYCTTKEEAKDNLQDTFLDIFLNIKKYKHKGSFEGWMKRIAINKAIDRYKKNIKTNPIDNFNVESEEILIDNIDEVPLNVILSFVQNLPNQYRLVFNLYELDNYSHKEIAKLLSISIGTSKSNLFRAKKILKDNIEQYQRRN